MTHLSLYISRDFSTENYSKVLLFKLIQITDKKNERNNQVIKLFAFKEKFWLFEKKIGLNLGAARELFI